MEPVGKNQMKVGIFVAIGLVVILLSILLLGGDRLFLRSKVYLYAEFDHVQGLAPGSVVSIAGVTVGNIRSISFVPAANKLRVKMRIDADFLDRVTAGSTVEIRTQGALGDKFIYIQPGDPQGKSLDAESTLPMQKSTDLMGIISERGSEADKFFEIINEVHTLMKSINQDNRVGQIIANFYEASKGLKATSGDAEKMMAELRTQSHPKFRDALDRVDRILAKVDRGEGTLGALINDSSLHESLKGILGTSERKKTIKSLIRGSIEKSEEK